jgi:polyferredoxin
MSLSVSTALKQGFVETSDCILCGECVKSCSKGVLCYGIRKTAKSSHMAQAAASEQDVL